MACHYPPDDDAPVFPVQTGDSFTRWCPILKVFETVHVLTANAATGLCRVLARGEVRVVSMTEIRERFRHPGTRSEAS
jgi:hypothetical protein